MSGLKSFVIAVIVVVLLIGYGSFYTVTEGQQALLLRLGSLVKNSKTGEPDVLNPGLHFKTPLIVEAKKFDTRLQTLLVESSRVLTADQKYLLVDYYVKWRIEDLPLYYTRTGGFADTAQNLLQQQTNDALRAAFGQRTVSELLEDRADLMKLLQQQASNTAHSLGIKVIDVRIKSIDLPQQVTSSVFARMSAEREQAASRYRSDGKAASEKISATADATVTVTLAQARAKAAAIRSEGLAEAAKIYSEAYQKDAAFYAFYRSLQAYVQTFNNKGDILVLNPDDQFFKYFKSASGDAAAKK